MIFHTVHDGDDWVDIHKDGTLALTHVDPEGYAKTTYLYLTPKMAAGVVRALCGIEDVRNFIDRYDY